MQKAEALIYDWCILRAPVIDCPWIKPAQEYERLDSPRPIVLHGRVRDDYRYNELTGEFQDTHRIITSRICEVGEVTITTENTIYTLEGINPQYAKFCEDNNYDIECAISRFYYEGLM